MNCPYCGADNATPGSNCPFCGGQVPVQSQSAPTTHQTLAEVPAHENVVLGIIGALIGSLLGAASIVLFDQLGYVASLSGLILAFCTLKGYQILGKRLGIAGIIISIIIMLVMPFAAYLVSSAMSVQKALASNGLNFSFMESFEYVVAVIKSGEVSIGDLIADTAMIYLFCVLGAFGTISNAIRTNKQ